MHRKNDEYVASELRAGSNYVFQGGVMAWI